MGSQPDIASASVSHSWGPGSDPGSNQDQRCTTSSALAGIPCSALYFVCWSVGDTGLSSILCSLLWRGYRAQHCTLSAGLVGIPGSALYFVLSSGRDTGLSTVLCPLVWSGYRAQYCTLSSSLAGIPCSALYFVL